MSPIGRIFIVLNLILSAAFLGWAANAIGTTEDLNETMAELKKTHASEITAKDDEIAKLGSSVSTVTEEKRQLREQRDALQAEVDRQKSQLEEYKRTSDSMRGDLTKIQSTLGEYNATIAQLTSQKDAAVERAHEAERQSDAAKQAQLAAELAMNDATEKAKNSELRIGDLEGEKVALTDKVSMLETHIAMIVDKTGFNLTDVVAPPPIEAYVLDVNRDLKLVVLNKGKKDNVKAGFTFSIYRGNQFKGQVRIQDVQDGLSSGIILNEKSSITKGDSATTTL